MVQHFLEKLDHDLKKSLIEQLRILWTHSSTAIEGNTLTLGETAQVLSEGLTISGKSLRDHNEVVGHARAFDLIQKYISENITITKKELFELHRIVQTEIVQDVYHPVGSWKNEPNSTVIVIDENQITNDTYAKPNQVESLMNTWLNNLNQTSDTFDPIKKYTELHTGFVRIHPFADGNGRLARLLSNFPLIKAGYVPVVIDRKKRIEYIHLLAKWQLKIGRVIDSENLIVKNQEYLDIENFFNHSWSLAQNLVDEHLKIQANR